jgi:hypothetical protein
MAAWMNIAENRLMLCAPPHKIYRLAGPIVAFGKDPGSLDISFASRRAAGTMICGG